MNKFSIASTVVRHANACRDARRPKCTCWCEHRYHRQEHPAAAIAEEIGRRLLAEAGQQELDLGPDPDLEDQND